jgi:antitoxin ParD1/3/4
MNISLTKELEAMVQEKVRSGLYASTSEVIRDALRALQEREQDREARLAALRKDIAIGLDQAAHGEVGPLDIEATIAKARRLRKARR